jgi:20S proteasome subunit alpha 6
MEAVKQGSAVIGLKSKTHALVVAFKRASSELGSHQKKVFKIDDHMGIGIAGLTADARVLCKYMRSECINHKFVYESPMQLERLVLQIADKSQVHTQRYGRRPYGVGLLVVGYDRTGPHLYETCPSGNYFEYKAQSIGARSQSAKTYLEKHFESFPGVSLDELVRHGLIALRETLQTGDTLSVKNVSIGIVGENHKFEIVEGERLQAYLNSVEEPQEQQAEPMQT